MYMRIILSNRKTDEYLGFVLVNVNKDRFDRAELFSEVWDIISRDAKVEYYPEFQMPKEEIDLWHKVVGEVIDQYEEYKKKLSIFLQSEEISLSD